MEPGPPAVLTTGPPGNSLPIFKLGYLGALLLGYLSRKSSLLSRMQVVFLCVCVSLCGSVCLCEPKCVAVSEQVQLCLPPWTWRSRGRHGHLGRAEGLLSPCYREGSRRPDKWSHLPIKELRGRTGNWISWVPLHSLCFLLHYALSYPVALSLVCTLESSGNF